VSTQEWAALVAANLCVLALVVLVVIAVRLSAAARALRQATAEFRAEAARALDALVGAAASADREIDRVDAIVTSAERMDHASRAAYRALANPVVKAMAAGTGARRAWTRLGRRGR
jgi:hypothetical protein